MASQKQIFEPTRYWVQIQRGIAYFIDLVFVLSPAIVYDFYLRPDKGNFTNLAPFFIAIFIYFTYFEYKYGQSLGKKLLGIKVFMDNGKQLTLKASLIRNVFRIIDSGIMLGGLLTLGVMYLTPKKQRIGDIFAHTVVVKIY